MNLKIAMLFLAAVAANGDTLHPRRYLRLANNAPDTAQDHRIIKGQVTKAMPHGRRLSKDSSSGSSSSGSGSGKSGSGSSGSGSDDGLRVDADDIEDALRAADCDVDKRTGPLIIGYVDGDDRYSRRSRGSRDRRHLKSGSSSGSDDDDWDRAVRVYAPGCDVTIIVYRADDDDSSGSSSGSGKSSGSGSGKSSGSGSGSGKSRRE